MIRLLLIVLLTPLTAHACTCIDNYVPLFEKICSSRSYGGVVAEVVLIDQPDVFTSLVSVAAVTVGSNVPATLRLYNGSGAMCGMSIAGSSPGQRFLLFTDSISVAEGDVYLFACASNRSLYEMNARGTQVEYGYVGENANNRGNYLKFQPFDRTLFSRACISEPDGKVNPLRAIEAYGNPGDGNLRLGTVAEDFPGLSKLEVYNSVGQRLRSTDLYDYEPDSVIDLTVLPKGYYFLVITDGIHRQKLPYIISH